MTFGWTIQNKQWFTGKKTIDGKWDFWFFRRWRLAFVVWRHLPFVLLLRHFQFVEYNLKCFWIFLTNSQTNEIETKTNPQIEMLFFRSTTSSNGQFCEAFCHFLFVILFNWTENCRKNAAFQNASVNCLMRK